MLNYYCYYYYYLIELQVGFYPLQWYCNKAQYAKIHTSHKITHHSQTKHSTQSYTNSKGHITDNEYNSRRSNPIPVIGRRGLWGCEMSRVPLSPDRWRLGCQPYRLTQRNPQKSSSTHFCWRLSKPWSLGVVGRIRNTEKNQWPHRESNLLPSCL
jgi:hypothetical protein